MSKRYKIISRKNGFRRAGLVFSTTEAIVLKADELDKVKLKQLKDEPMLVVVELKEKTSDDEETSNDEITVNVSKTAQELIDEHKLNIDDIEGTGKDGQIIKTDVKKIIEDLEKEKAPK